ncbi:hypothetical protein IKQ26_05800 [bacterium]|nr:hypothetical protein [bacterium]
MTEENKDIKKFKIKLKNIKDKLKLLWKKIWGKDLSEDDNDYNSTSEDIFEEIEQQKKYKHTREGLKAKRELVISVSAIILFVIIYLIFCALNHIVKTNEFFACFGKDVCIYKGKESNYSHFFYPMYTKISNDEIFIMHFPWLYEEQCDAEIYSAKENKFKKVTDFRKLLPIIVPNSNGTMQSKVLNITKNDSNEIIMIDYLQPIYKYSLKDKIYTNTYKDYISSNNYVYLTPYKNKILLMSNFNHF